MSIRVLPPDVAIKIAAGEIVERPASVVKELVENSLDAQATQITVEVRGGGTQLIRVTDDGSGIPPDEVDLAFRRHATSKITGLADLQSVATLGFRGEALPSIIAVAEVTMITRPRSELAGHYVSFKGGMMVEEGRRGCPEGTSVAVRHLFAAVPARLKFLKSSSTEVSRISQLVTQYALAHPEVRFTLFVDGRDVFHTPGSGKLYDALVEAYGLETAKQMSEVEQRGRAGEGGVHTWGYFSPPAVTRGSRSYLSFFVNRRWVQNRRVAYAVDEAYRGLLQVGRHPLVVLNIELPPADVDVNVHPTKNEVKFVREDEVFDAVYRSLRAALMESAPVPAMHLPATGGYPDTHPTALPLSTFDAGGWNTGATSSWSAMPTGRSEAAQSTTGNLPALRILGQVAETYIIAEGPDGMYLIDQHTAHERVLFEKIQRQLGESKVQSQGLLEPISIELTPSQDELLQSKLPSLFEGGFEIESFGDRTCLIRAVPSVLVQGNPTESLLGILDDLNEGSSAIEGRERLAMSLACHGAVRAGQTLTFDEMRELVRQLEKADLPRTCPHGRPTMIHLSAMQLEKEFGRR